MLLGQAGIREVCFAKWCGAPRGGAHPVFFEAKNSKWIITESPSRQLAASKTPVGPPVPLAIFPARSSLKMTFGPCSSYNSLKSRLIFWRYSGDILDAKTRLYPYRAQFINSVFARHRYLPTAGKFRKIQFATWTKKSNALSQNASAHSTA